jgi:hypothetical protein
MEQVSGSALHIRHTWHDSIPGGSGIRFTAVPGSNSTPETDEFRHGT